MSALEATGKGDEFFLCFSHRIKMEESSLNTCLQILFTFTPFMPVILVCSSALNVTDAN